MDLEVLGLIPVSSKQREPAILKFVRCQRTKKDRKEIIKITLAKLFTRLNEHFIGAKNCTHK